MSEERTYTVADAMIDVLKAHGVSTIFGYPGGAILPFYDALPYHPEIKHILTRNEQGAGFAAQGWARTTNEVGVCCATSGPGGTNLVTAIADAFMDSIPMLAITGQVPLEMIGKDMFQEVDMTGITLNITKHNYLLEKPEDTVRVMSEAIYIATHGRKGPVHVDVPKNIMAREHPREFEIPKIDFSETDATTKAFKELGPDVFEEVFDLLARAKRPVMLLGHGVKLSGADHLAEQLINSLGIPTVTTLLAKGVIKDDNPNYHGMLGMHGFYHANMTVHHADLIFNIGSRFDDRIVGRYDAFGADASIIHVDVDSSELGKIVTTDLPIHSDAKLFIERMLSHKRLEHLAVDSWRERIKDWEDANPYEHTPEGFTMRNVLKHISNIVNEDPDKYILVTDVGQHQMWASLSCVVDRSLKWLTSGGAGTMGFGLPTALGAAFANPDKTIICITGDGGIQMNIQEFGVLQDYPLNVKVCILNNSFLGMVRQWQELFYEHNYSAVNITSPEYETVAKGYHLPGYTIRHNEELNTNLFTEPGPAIIDCHVEKEDNVFPMVPGGKHLGETITQKE